MAAARTSTKDSLTSVTGMYDLMGSDYYAHQGFFEKAQEICEYYGFQPIETPVVEHTELFTKGIGTGTDIVDKEMYDFKLKKESVALRPEYTTAMMRAYIENSLKSQAQPVMLYSYGPLFRNVTVAPGCSCQFRQFHMSILGNNKSVSDAMVIQTAMKILEEAGAKDLMVDINSLGDKESRSDYLKELRSYYRKHVNKLADKDRELLKTNPLQILASHEAATIEVNEEAPDSMAFLNTASKKHFKEVLEFLEEMGVQYRMQKSVIKGPEYYSNTVFEIVEMKDVEEEAGNETEGEKENKPKAPEPDCTVIASGGRYDYLPQALGHRKDIPGVGIGIGVERVIQSDWWQDLNPRNKKTPKIYFIQLGFDAKLKSLAIVETLRKAKVPIAQSLSKDSLSSQLTTAQNMGVPYVLIFGQKEAMDGAVILRNMSTRSQKVIKIDNLVKEIKKLK